MRRPEREETSWPSLPTADSRLGAWRLGGRLDLNPLGRDIAQRRQLRVAERPGREPADLAEAEDQPRAGAEVEPVVQAVRQPERELAQVQARAMEGRLGARQH